MTHTIAAPLDVTVGGPTGTTIPTDLWGLFLEDLNDALDGGLNAELVRNGDFEFNPADRDGWHALTAWTSSDPARVAVRREDPVHRNNGTYVRLTGPVTLVNDGFDPVAVVPGARYAFSAFTWAVEGSGCIVLALEGDDGVLATVDVPVEPGGWNPVAAELTGQVAGAGRLSLTVPAGLTVEIDVVSLRPVGPDGAPLTFRPDLLETLRALHPAFIRFPGGCLAHGLGLDNMYHWKGTVGPRHEREQTFNTWGYHQSRQIGYLEYFQLCRELDATPMPIVAAGVCCQNLRGRARAIPQDEMPAYVQDVLDLIEFANGGTDTFWGARRAELGSPEPFEMRYLGVGNEDEITDDFRERYAQIADAVAAAYPDVTVIGTAGPAPFGADFEAGWEFARAQKVAIVDEHAYRTPRWFHQNIDRYADYPRDGALVYLGEWAARTNTVRSALAEAAFMTAIERDSDVVALASYAPLLARVGHTQWVPDLIYFDAERVLPSASYFVQQAFAAEPGGEVCAVSLTGAEPVPVPGWAGGAVRVSAGGSEVELTRIGLDGAAVQPARVVPASEAHLGRLGGRGVLEFTATRSSGDDGLVVCLGNDGGDTVELSLGGWQNKSTTLALTADGIGNEIDGPHQGHRLLTGVPIVVRLEVGDHRFRVWLDGELVHDVTLDLRPEHRVVAGASRRPGADGDEYVVRLVNATDTARAATVTLPVDGDVTGSATLLAGAGPEQGSPEADSPVRPEQVAVSGSGGFSLSLPAWSFASVVARADA